MSDNLLHQCAIDKAALHRLSLLTTTANVTSASEDFIHYQDLWYVVVVTKCKAIRDTLRLIDVNHDEKVNEGFV